MNTTLVIGKTIKMPCMRKGLCRYEEGKKETILLNQLTLEEMSKSAHGIPVIIQHQEVDSGNVKAITVGRVADMHYDPETDEWLAHFVVDDQKAVELLQNGWGVSTAYGIIDSAAGGTLNNVPYDREITKAKYLHLAIVKHPRYEMAKNPVFYNSKEGGKKMLLKLWKKINEQIKLNDNDEVYVEVDGKEVALNSIMEEMDAMKKNEDEKAAKVKAELENAAKKHKMNGDDEVEYNGEKMTVNELVKRHSVMKKKNEEDEGKKEEKDEEKKEGKKNEVEPPVVADPPVVEVPDPEVVKEAAKNFDSLNNAAALNAEIDDGSGYKSVHERMLEGQQKYGSKK